MKETRINDEDYREIEEKINELRSKLNRAFEINGHTEEVVKMSQELDRYILLAQRELLKLKK